LIAEGHDLDALLAEAASTWSLVQTDADRTVDVTAWDGYRLVAILLDNGTKTPVVWVRTEREGEVEARREREVRS
jgi:hypothetical protein